MRFVVPIPSSLATAQVFTVLRQQEAHLKKGGITAAWRLTPDRKAVANPPVADLSGNVVGTVSVTPDGVVFDGVLGRMARLVTTEAKVEAEVSKHLAAALSAARG